MKGRFLIMAEKIKSKLLEAPSCTGRTFAHARWRARTRSEHALHSLK